jgi:general secretion pathway protein G
VTRRKNGARVFFPWEKKRGVFGLVGRARARLVLGALFGLGFLVFLHQREERAAGVRATRATITNVTSAVLAYRADHGGNCPRELGELAASGYVRDLPLDAWGRPLRLACSSPSEGLSVTMRGTLARPTDPMGFRVSSDGPDGVPGGLDRVE